MLNKVTTGFGTELTGMPSFGIITLGERPLAILRGEMNLLARSGTSEFEVSGREVTTWSERSLPTADQLTLRLGGVGESRPELPLAEGVVRLSSLLLGEPASAEPAGAEQISAEQVNAGQIEPTASADTALPSVPMTPIVPAQPAFAPQQPAEPEPAEQESAGPAETPFITPVQAPELSQEQPPAQVDEADLSRTLASSDFADLAEQPLSQAAEQPIEPGPSTAGALAESEEADQPLVTEAQESTTSYDHLWDRTVSRSVEDAAIRASEEAETPLEPVVAAEQAAPAAEELAAEAPEVPGAPEVAEAPPAFGQPVQPPSTAPASPFASGLIDSVPWQHTDADPSAASVQAGVPQPAPANADHDGQTVMRTELDDQPAPQQAFAEPAVGTGALVLARLCANGHANPPTYARCAACGQPMSGDALQVRRPVLGQMRISTGEVIDLDRSLVVGRQPSVSRVNGEGMPKLIQVRSQAGDISRSHVEIRLEGWDVVLVDLKATNGTVLVRDGQPPRRLGQGEQALLLNGDIAELGEDVSLRFEGLL